jgi:putative ABC transport system substrate-binding protein
MKRREFMLLLGGVAAAWPLGAEAQQPERTRRLGVLMGWAENDPQAQLRLSVFKERLAALGWAEGRNLKIEVRRTEADVDRASAFAKELTALQPDVIMSGTTPATAALQRETRTIPIVFAAASDPVGSGFVKTLARPGGNITGFINLESSLVEKWLQLLKEIAPRVTRAAVMFNPQTAPYAEYYLQPLNAVAANIGVKTITATASSEAEIERVIAGLGRETGGGLIVLTDSFMLVHRRSIIQFAARSKVPAIYWNRAIVEDGGLISYGVDLVDQYRRAASHVDRILRGAKPAELPVEQPTKFELFVNLKTAKALGLTLPPSLLLRADKVIE